MNSAMSVSNRTLRFGEILQETIVTENRHEGPIDIDSGVSTLIEKLTDLRRNGNSLYILGNGGSAAVASHAAIDFLNNSQLKALTLHESSSLTCMANDYGYENAFSRMLEQLVRSGDMVITISSSGQSINIRNAAAQAIKSGATVITLSGFEDDNPLRSMGSLNFWLDSSDYGMVEIGHQFILHNVSDRLSQQLQG